MKRTIFSLSILAIVFQGCIKTNTVNPPDKATLTFPADNSECTSGTVISNTQATITFVWAASANTDAYELTVKNLLTNVVITQPTATNSATVTLSRGTPYSWSVVSISVNTPITSNSDLWKFYVAGTGIVNYAPFPATITSPMFGQSVNAQNGKLNLTWVGSSISNNIVSYDVYLGTTAIPPLYKSGITGMTLNNVSVLSSTTYYWKVITTDANGSTSDSGVYQFNVN